MPIAAVPDYLGQNFKDASPGMRFGMYLPIWTCRADQENEVRKRAEARSREGDEVSSMLAQQGMDATIRALQQRPRNPLAGLWEKNDFAARSAWKEVTRLNPRDQDTMKHLLKRQQAAFRAASMHDAATLSLHAESVAPFTTGLGNEHPLENGFAFLTPYGLPYLPGSGVKGVLRQAARELASGEWSDPQNTQEWNQETIDALLGRETENGDTQHLRGALSFWDVIPQIKGDALAVDIMTPHQSHYYQGKTDKKSGDSIHPHDSGAPNPISFLTVPPGAGFIFHVCCDLAHLARLAPQLADGGRWKPLLEAAFQHAFDWLGFGAKTSVGYGALEIDKKAQDKAQAAEKERAQQQAKETRLAGMTPNEQKIDTFASDCEKRFNELRGSKDTPNGVYHGKARELAKAAHEGADWTAQEKKAAAEAIIQWLPQVVRLDIKDERKKLKLAVLLGTA